MGWFVDDELLEGALLVDGAVLVPEDDGVAGAALVDGLLIELDAGALFVPPDEALLDGAAFVPLDDELLDGAALVPLEALLEADGEPDAHFSCAAWVFGPMMPSIVPGSQPWSLSCCWSCFTDSSPLGADIAVEAT